MQKLYSNLKQGEIKVRVTNPDDLWSLSQIIEQGDTIKGITTRKIKMGDAGESVKKTMFITILAESVEFHEYQNSLRVSGKVLEAPEDVPKGSYHTINVEQDSVVSIVKGHWAKYQLDRLHEALEEQPQALICVFDREYAYFALLKKYKYELLLELHGTVQKKEDATKVTSNFYQQIIGHLKEYSERYNTAAIILASPAFWREYLMEELKDEALKKRYGWQAAPLQQ
ncbi:pelota family protein [Candidatus Woesearchaeota archaeon]|nr:pelota family protein [Candidatus Woesearchaeota archaeon]